MAGAVTQGRCLCGSIEFECTGAPSVCCLCHCRMYRTAVGATPVAWATYRRDQLRVVRGQPQRFASSAAAQRSFCATCGCSLFFETTRSPDEIDVTIVTLASADVLAPDRHIWVPSKLAWARTDDGLPCHVEDAESPIMPNSRP